MAVCLFIYFYFFFFKPQDDKLGDQYVAQRPLARASRRKDEFIWYDKTSGECNFLTRMISRVINSKTDLSVTTQAIMSNCGMHVLMSHN